MGWPKSKHKGKKQTGTRLDPDVHRTVKREAERNRRSMNSEINLRLKASYVADKILEAAE